MDRNEQRRPGRGGGAADTQFQRQDGSTAEAAPLPTRDTLTIVRSRSGVLTKRIAASPQGWRITPFSAGRWYSGHEREVDGLATMAGVLQRCVVCPSAAIVRGALRPGVDRSRCRRLSDRAQHGEDVTFDPRPRRWLAIDVDGLEEPSGCVFAAEPEDGIEHALECLPEPFQDASCWWQATSSAGIKPGVRCRLWFWLDRPIDDAEAKGWLQGAPADRSIYTPVALHYVADPILEGGTRDPIARRHGVRRGLADTVSVPAELPRVETVGASPVAFDGEELTSDDLVALAAAVLREPRAGAIWEGEKTFPDRSTSHFALAAALARGGCTDPDTLHRALIAYDRRRGHNRAKILRPDYAKRTIGAALAAGGCA